MTYLKPTTLEPANHQSEVEAFHQKGRVIFEKILPELIETHFNWFIYIELESQEYFIAPDSIIALKQALKKYPQAQFAIFQINKTGGLWENMIESEFDEIDIIIYAYHPKSKIQNPKLKWYLQKLNLNNLLEEYVFVRGLKS